jgi:glutathione S-transferase
VAGKRDAECAGRAVADAFGDLSDANSFPAQQVLRKGRAPAQKVLHRRAADLAPEPAYRNAVNARGEVPALRLDDGRIITEITAICGYFDEIAEGGRRLFGETPEDRAGLSGNCAPLRDMVA